MYICVYTYVYIYIYINIYTYIYIYMNLTIPLIFFTFDILYIYKYMYMRICFNVYIYTYIYIHAYTFIYIGISINGNETGNTVMTCNIMDSNSHSNSLAFIEESVYVNMIEINDGGDIKNLNVNTRLNYPNTPIKEKVKLLLFIFCFTDAFLAGLYTPSSDRPPSFVIYASKHRHHHHHHQGKIEYRD
jgi:hypothetical protein